MATFLYQDQGELSSKINFNCVNQTADKKVDIIMIVLLFFLMLHRSSSGGVPLTQVPGQDHMMTDFYYFDNSALASTGPLASNFNITFVNGFGGPVGVSNYYSAYVSIINWNIYLNDEANRVISISSLNRWYDKAEFSIYIDPQQKIVFLQVMLLFVDILYPTYLFGTNLLIYVNNLVGPSMTYANDYPFNRPLTDYTSPKLKLLPLFTTIDFHTIAANNYGFQYRPIFTLINNTHIHFNILNQNQQFFLIYSYINLLVIEMDDAPLYNRFLDIALSHTLNDGLTSDSYTGSTHLITKYAVFGSLFLMSHHFDSAQPTLDRLSFNYIYAQNTYIQIQWQLGQVSYIQARFVFFYNVFCPSAYPYYNSDDDLCYDNCPSGYIGNLSVQLCMPYIQYCKQTSLTGCLSCLETFLLSNDSKSCTCPNGEFVTTNACNNLTGCLSMKLVAGLPVCQFCDVLNGFSLINNECYRKSGYQLSNTTSSNISQCLQICGDGIVYQLQCDDGNIMDGDGCSSNCTIQNSFVCYLDQSLKTVCQYALNIQLSLISIMKIDNQKNSAILTFNINNNYLPYLLNLQMQDILITGINGVTILKVFSENQSLKIIINYSETIEGQSAFVQFNFFQTLYLSQNSVLYIQTIGDNDPLIYSGFLQTLKSIGYGSTSLGFFGLIILFVALPAPKFIGVETIEIIQLFYFSLLLNYPITSWSPIYQSLTPLKYANGYHFKIKSNDEFLTKITFFRKIQLLGFEHDFLNNNNITILILFAITIVFGVFLVKKQKMEKEILSLEMLKIPYIKQKQVYFDHLLSMQKIYKLAFHFCMFIFLQVFASIIMIAAPYKEMLKQQALYFNLIDIFSLILTLAIVTIFLLNNFINILLTELKSKKIKYRYQSHELLNVRVNILYLFIMSVFIFMFNQKQVCGVPMSVLVFLIQFVYIIGLIKINPYKFSLRLHRVSLVFNHVCFLIYLGFICFNNLFCPAQNYQIFLCYFALLASTIIFLLAIVRIYYQYRYGNSLDQAIKKKDQLQKKLKQQKNAQKQAEQLKWKINRYQKQAKERAKKIILTQKIYTDDNQYLFVNQKKEQQKQDLISWLQTRHNWSQQQKQQYYYRHFSEKPLSWLQKHDPKKYDKIKQKQMKKKQITLKNDQDLEEQQRLAEYKKELRAQIKHKKITKINK